MSHRVFKSSIYLLLACLFSVTTLSLLGCGQKKPGTTKKYVQFQAHRGVSSEAPENTMAAFKLAADYGYSYIELDPAVTKDGVVVILHDNTITRTARKAPPPSHSADPADYPQRIDQLTYAEVAQFDFGSYYSDDFIGEKIPRLDEVLEFAEKRKIALKIDAKIWRLSSVDLESVFKLIDNSKASVGISCKTVEQSEQVAARLADCHIHFDGNVNEEILQKLKTVAGDKLFVWVPYKCNATNWVKVDFIDHEKAVLVKQYAKLGIWVLDSEDQLAAAVDLYADVIETNGNLKPRPIEVKAVSVPNASE